MPRPSKSGKRRPYAKKPTLRKAKKVVSKALQKARVNNLDTYSLRCVTNVAVTPQQGSTVSNFIYGYFPLLQTGTPNTYDVRNNPDFTLYRALYDRVRVNRVTIKVTPKANVLSQGEAQADGNFNVTGDGVVHTAIDRDSAVPVALDGFRKMSSYKQYSVMKKFQRSYSVRWPTSQWLDTGAFLSTDTQITRTIGCSGGITIYAENLLEDSGELLNEPWAMVEVIYDCVFQGKTMKNVTVDEHGAVCMTDIVDKETPDPNILFRIVKD